MQSHVKDEEGDILPQLRKAVPRRRLVEMGELMQAAKKMAPTRPHPRAPSTPPANIVAGPVAVAVDRLRDAAGGR